MASTEVCGTGGRIHPKRIFFLAIVVVVFSFASLFPSHSVLSPKKAVFFTHYVIEERQGVENKKIAADTHSQLHYVFGFSTGHAGSTTAQAVLKKKGCPWEGTGIFEKRVRDERKATSFRIGTKRYNAEADKCSYTRDKVIPFLDEMRGNKTWIDMGHYHNRGPILECFASLLGSSAAFVRIRRNRYDIAISHVRQYKEHWNISEAPCKAEGIVVYCPSDQVGPVALPVQIGIWNQLTDFQKFLWLADELEYRFHKLKMEIPGPRYLEMTWSTGDELAVGIKEVRSQLGCESGFSEVPNKQQHRGGSGMRNCSDYILQDLAYRTLVSYNEEKKNVLFAQHPQVVNNEKCMDTRDELIRAIRSSPEESLDNWVLPGQ
jgi:hypothetical protein